MRYSGLDSLHLRMTNLRLSSRAARVRRYRLHVGTNLLTAKSPADPITPRAKRNSISRTQPLCAGSSRSSKPTSLSPNNAPQGHLSTSLQPCDPSALSTSAHLSRSDLLGSLMVLYSYRLLGASSFAMRVTIAALICRFKTVDKKDFDRTSRSDPPLSYIGAGGGL